MHVVLTHPFEFTLSILDLFLLIANQCYIMGRTAERRLCPIVDIPNTVSFLVCYYAQKAAIFYLKCCHIIGSFSIQTVRLHVCVYRK